MSYDLLAFDPGAAPGDDELLAWYQKQAEWSEPHSYDDPAVTTPGLRAFYRDLVKIFRPLNGPDAPVDDDSADTTYAIGSSIVYVAFRWSKEEHAREVFLRLARVHGVGVCEVSETPAAIHRPAGKATAVSPAAAVSTDAQSVPGLATGRVDAIPATESTDEKGEGRLYL
ncbi:hypothetical protein A5791_18505 [Mycobacterium sp. 852002-51163_SCH5372311]|uniref:hypothetical protein n=1 Tax=Mycobacterium sp. 852002-51163_SCH5372311 TaxID=1834097 RepID=UPI0007FBD4BB|nr:hypothetical protein [Mycobacterium sp. 852002-51163_SCH5372311]OBF87921.1 hypothetical protein A5791_18505 [Mycobacterium sp. 852002-51163_SCH5372311]